MTTQFSWRRSYAYLVLATVLSVAVADFFFYGHIVGWTAAGFGAVMLALLALRDSRFLCSTGGKVVTVASIALILVMIEQPTFLRASYLILCLGGLSIVNAFGWQDGFPEWGQRWGKLLATGWMRLFSDNSIVVRFMVRHGMSPTLARGVLAWTLPVILTSVFVGIFAWANPIVADWLGSLGNWLSWALEKVPDWINIPRLLFWTVFAAFAWMLFRVRNRRHKKKIIAMNRVVLTLTNPQIAYEIPAEPLQLSVGLVVRCLILFNLVFLVENILDLRYLFDRNALPAGMEYKEYVRRGAYPLVAAALLAGLFVLMTFRPESSTERSIWARRLVYGWIGQTIFLTLSAAWRLYQYVEMSELTRLRVASTVWFLLVGLGLFYIIWRIVAGRSNRWLLNANALTAAVAIYLCCFANFDRMIAEFNVRHCAEGGGSGSILDVEYFRALGPTALPALESIRPQLRLAWQIDQVRKVSQDLHQELSQEMSDWRGWTLRRQRAYEAAEQQFALSREKHQKAQATGWRKN